MSGIVSSRSLFAAGLLLLLCVSSAHGLSVISPRPMGKEERIKVINYLPNSVFKFTGHYYYQSIIEFAPGESIDNILLGTSGLWQIHVSGNRMLLKPTADDATTNMTVITDKRMYFFELYAEEARDINDPNISFIMKFLYPQENVVEIID